MSSPIRRVIAGKDAAGKAIMILDAAATAVQRREELGVTNTLLWVLDSIPTDFSDPADIASQKAAVVPGPEGSIFRIIEFAPEKEVKSDYDTRPRIFQGLGLTPEGDSLENRRGPALHRTKTVDYALIVSGEIDMLLDDTVIHLKEGDVVIQRGANHGWVNRGDRPCRVAFVVIE